MKKRLIALFLCVMLTAAFAVPSLAAAPAGAKYFPLEDLTGVQSTGDRSDKVGNGTITFAEGKVGNAAVFNGFSGISLGKDIIKGRSYSVAMWVKIDMMTNHTPVLFGLAPGDPIRWISFLPLSWDNKYGVWSDSGDGHWNDLFADKSLPLGEWVHIAFTSESAGDYNNVQLYLNGQEVLAGPTERDQLNGIFEDGGDFFLGVNLWDPPFQGMIDELYIYNGTTLSAAQITAVMNADGSGSSGTGNPKTGDNLFIYLALTLLAAAALAGAVTFRKSRA